MTSSENIDKLFEYVKKHDFELVHRSGGDKIRFFTTRAEWVCWCCGALRVMVNEKPKCIYGIVYREDLVDVEGSSCEYYQDRRCVRNNGCDYKDQGRGYP